MSARAGRPSLRWTKNRRVSRSAANDAEGSAAAGAGGVARTVPGRKAQAVDAQAQGAAVHAAREAERVGAGRPATTTSQAAHEPEPEASLPAAVAPAYGAAPAAHPTTGHTALVAHPHRGGFAQPVAHSRAQRGGADGPAGARGAEATAGEADALQDRGGGVQHGWDDPGVHGERPGGRAISAA